MLFITKLQIDFSWHEDLRRTVASKDHETFRFKPVSFDRFGEVLEGGYVPGITKGCSQVEIFNVVERQ